MKTKNITKELFTNFLNYNKDYSDEWYKYSNNVNIPGQMGGSDGEFKGVHGEGVVEATTRVAQDIFDNDVKNRLDNPRQFFSQDNPKFIKDVADLFEKEQEDTWLNYLKHTPFLHQKILRKYLSEETPYRGILVYHGLGSGKTVTSILIANNFREKDIVVMLPASLRSNYENDLTDNYLNRIPGGDKDSFKARLKYIHYNAGSTLIDTLYTELICGNCIGKSRIQTILHNKEKLEKFKSLKVPGKILYWNTEIKKNPFDDKVIIVDEVHNLISMINNRSPNADFIFRNLMDANNCRIVFLSGTPVINDPYELAIIFNILRGYIKTYKISGDDITRDNYEMLRGHPSVQNVILNPQLNSYEIMFTPNNFIIAKNEAGEDVLEYNEGTDDGEGNGDGENIPSLIATLSKKSGNIKGEFEGILRKILNTDIEITKCECVRYNMFDIFSEDGDHKEEFYNKYIGDIDGTLYVKNSNVFKKRIIGLVSYFHELLTDFPTHTDKLVNVTMSKYQLLRYCESRYIEYKLEKINRKKPAGGQIFSEKDANYFKVFSRQLGLFVFPDKISRPRKADYSNNADYMVAIEGAIEELETADQPIGGEENEGGKASIVINKFLSSKETKDFVKGTPDVPVGGDVVEANVDLNNTLEYLSPKYKKILDTIDLSEGCVFVYSQFLTVEGITMLSKVLKYNGYYDRTDDVPGDDIFKVGDRVRIILEGKEVPKLLGEYTEILLTSDEEASNYTCYTGIVIDNTDTDTGYGIEIPKLENKVLKNIEFRFLSHCVFDFWTGSKDVEARNETIKLFNDDDGKNRFGQQCLILLSTAAGSEGISLKCIRQVHIIEPYWNMVRIDQVIGRARRAKSHNSLDLSKREVESYRYIIKLPDDIDVSGVIDYNIKNISFMVDGKDKPGLEKLDPAIQFVSMKDNMYKIRSNTQILLKNIEENAAHLHPSSSTEAVGVAQAASIGEMDTAIDSVDKVIEVARLAMLDAADGSEERRLLGLKYNTQLNLGIYKNIINNKEGFITIRLPSTPEEKMGGNIPPPSTSGEQVEDLGGIRLYIIENQFSINPKESIDEILTFDEFKSSDEKLNEISDKKLVLINMFLKLLKDSAIDCEINKLINSEDKSLEDIQCIVADGDMGLTYDLDETKDLDIETRKNTTGKKKPQIIKKLSIQKFTIRKKKYILKIVIPGVILLSTTLKDDVRNQGFVNIYDYYELKNNKKKVIISKLLPTKNTFVFNLEKSYVLNISKYIRDNNTPILEGTVTVSSDIGSYQIIQEE